MRYFQIFILFTFILNTASAQQYTLATFQWRTHYEYAVVKKIEATETHVYAASALGFFRTQYNNFEAELLGKTKGFWGTAIANLQYHETSKTLIICYSDGAIDLLKNNNEIISVRGFYTKQLQGDKTVSHIHPYNNFAYLSTQFGILVLDVVKAEIKDSYLSIGAGGQSLPVYATSIARDSIFASTQTGLIKAKLSPLVNLNDFNNWQKTPISISFKHLHPLGDSLIAATDTLVYVCYNGKTNTILDLNKKRIARIAGGKNSTLVYREGAITELFRNTNPQSFPINLIAAGTREKNGAFWYSNGLNGGAIKILNNQEYSLMPQGPTTNRSYKMTKSGSKLLVTAGGVASNFGNAFIPDGYNIFDQNQWYRKPQTSLDEFWFDYTVVVNNPVTGKSYVGSHSKGLLELDGRTVVKRYDAANSTLRTVPNTDLLRITGLAVDKQGNLWVSNYDANLPLHKLTPDGNWVSYSLPQNNIREIVIDDYNTKWIVLEDNNQLLMAFNEEPQPGFPNGRIRFLNKGTNKIKGKITAIEIDKNGSIWLGSSDGISIINTGDRVFDPGFVVEATENIVEENGVPVVIGGTEYINDLLIDGGNRKWLATNNGLFLIDAEGRSTKIIYNSESSPLPSNVILTLGYTDNTGEIFIGTNSGIVSLRTDATAAENKFGKIKIFPNPVSPDYSGPITIAGLAKDAEIRITDAAGGLVFIGKANGGTMVWNGLRQNGTKPSSGIYLVFGINTDGTETAMGKLIYIKGK